MRNILKQALVVGLLVTAVACKTETKKAESEPQVKVEEKTTPVLSEGDIIINKAIKAHGGKLYDNASYQFTFRNKQYTFTNSNNSYKYTVKRTKDGKEIYDVLDNGNLSRTIDGQSIALNDKDRGNLSEALNSVIYFATLPYKLKDKAVHKTHKGKTVIKGEEYEVVKVTFSEDGGGKDFEDQYYYWVNTKTNTVDYLAYNYQVNNGGVRFRSSYNRRNVDGILFQDYVNYKAEVGTPLADLPALYEKGALKEVSRIDTENVINLAKQ